MKINKWYIEICSNYHLHIGKSNKGKKFCEETGISFSIFNRSKKPYET